MPKITKEEARKRVLKNWAQWRLLLSDISITYSDLDNMSHEDIAEANAALDIHLEAIEKDNKQK
jgi:hypothetical protein